MPKCSQMFSKSSLQVVKDVGTIGEQVREITMIAEIKDVVTRSSDTLIGDALGVVSLFALLIAGLALPALL